MIPNSLLSGLNIFLFATFLSGPVLSQAQNKLASESYFNIRNGLFNFYSNVTKKKRATVAYIGGSITAGAGWRNQVDSFLTTKFPSTRFRFINAAIPSLGSKAHAFRLDQDLFSLGRIDLLFVEAAVNDLGTDSVLQIRALKGISGRSRA